MPNGGEEEEFYQALRLVMKAVKERGGLNPERYRPALRLTGEVMGRALARLLTSTSLADLLEELSERWASESLGEMEVESLSPLRLSLRSCYDCLGVKYGVGVPLCPYKEGLLKAVFEERLGQAFDVTEEQCCGTFAEHCIFRIEPRRSR